MAKRIPSATYRLQLNADFPFSKAREILDYLVDLGISDVYLSPIFRASPGSSHGYDVCGFDQVNPALGSVNDFENFAGDLKQRSLGCLLDMVPNHMGNDLSNRWWRDVLQFGPRSAYAAFFDIQWEAQTGANGRVLLPILEEQYATVLHAGKLKVEVHEGELVLAYYDKKLPLSPSSAATLLKRFATALPGAFSDRVRDYAATFVSAGLTSDLSCSTWRLFLKLVKEGNLEPYLEKFLESCNGRSGNQSSFDFLHEIIGQQHYRLAFWRVGPEEINYRRFFDITTLVALRMELPEVFHATHAQIECMVRNGFVTGLRIDHPDGLKDPEEYFRRLQQLLSPLGQASEHRFHRSQTAFYVVAEKILSPGESVRPEWAIDGTTGYDFLNAVNRLFLSQAGLRKLDSFYAKISGQSIDFPELVFQCKEQVLSRTFISELASLAGRLKILCAQSRIGQDLTYSQIHSATKLLLAAFSVYRTYVTARTETPDAWTVSIVESAIAAARHRGKELPASAFDFLSQLLLQAPALWNEFEPSARHQAEEAIARFQQLAGPVMAKGLEDTAFYRYQRLIALNEVGGEPDPHEAGIPQLHQFNQQLLRETPNSLLATATHDTKRGEDVRARLMVLSEMPDEWEQFVRQASELNQQFSRSDAGKRFPSIPDELLFYQTVVGAWPAPNFWHDPEALKQFKERVNAFMIKAIREAKLETSWTEQNEDYENAVSSFVAAALESSHPKFLQLVEKFHLPLAHFGKVNSLAQLLLKLTSPGVPDTYQGTECWDLSLVDPDNRRPVDYLVRRSNLQWIRSEESRNPAGLLTQLLREADNGRIKQYVLWKLLTFRRDNPNLFQHGSYQPLKVSGPAADHLCAFSRIQEEKAILIAVPTLGYTLCRGKLGWPIGASIWQGSVELPQALQERSAKNLFSRTMLKAGNSLDVGETLLRDFPVCCLVFS